MKSFKVIILAAIFAALASAGLAFHANTARADDSCALTPADFAKIAAVQNDPSFTPDEEVVQELAVRKALLTQTITCAQGEVQSLQGALENATTTSDTQNIQSQLLGGLNDASNFYNIETIKLSGSGISGSENIAREIIAWRAGTYIPLEGQINNYLLWTQNQALFSTAQARMDQTQQAVAFIEGASANANLQNTFNGAYASFQSAKQENAAAEAALAQSLPPDQSLALIKQSLASLSDTYQQFFAVSDAIKALLP